MKKWDEKMHLADFMCQLMETATTGRAARAGRKREDAKALLLDVCHKVSGPELKASGRASLVKLVLNAFGAPCEPDGTTSGDRA